MKQSDLFLCATALVFAGCASAPAAVDLELATSSPASANDAFWSADDLEVWSTPGFREEFIQSFAKETELAPKLTLTELEMVPGLFDLISSKEDAEVEQAVRMLQEVRNADSNEMFDYLLANLYFQQDRLDHAAATYRVAVEKLPTFRGAWKNLGILLVRMEEFDEAIGALAKVIELGGGNGTTYGLLGYAHAAVGNDLAAESAYRMATMLDPAASDWKMGLARSLFTQRRYRDAAALCELMIKEQPENPDLWLLQANAFIGLGEPLRAAENYELVDRLGASTFDSLAVLGDIYINEGLFDVATGTYGRALELDPGGEPDRALRAAKALTARSAHDETLELIANIEAAYATTLDDDAKKELLKMESRIAMARGAGDEEARILEEIVALDPLDGDATILLGQYAQRSGDLDTAVTWYERAKGIEGFEADANVRHAQLLVSQRKYDEAIRLLERAQEAEYRDSIADYLDKVQRVSQGR